MISVLHRGDKTCVDVEHGFIWTLLQQMERVKNVSPYFSIRRMQNLVALRVPRMVLGWSLWVCLWYLLGRLSSGTLNYWDSGWLWPEDRKIFFVESFFGKPLFLSRMGAGLWLEIVANLPCSYFSSYKRITTVGNGNIRRKFLSHREEGNRRNKT